MTVVRYAIVQGCRTLREVEAYMPSNYEVIHSARWVPYEGATYDVFTCVIKGEDSCGWTLDDYVIPRLQSGLIGCKEIDLSHPIMKTIPITA